MEVTYRAGRIGLGQCRCGRQGFDIAMDPSLEIGAA